MEPFISLGLKEGAHVVAACFYRGGEVISADLTPEQRKAYYDAENQAVDRINADFYKYAHHITAHANGALQPHELLRAFVRYKHVDYYDPVAVRPHIRLDEGARADRGRQRPCRAHHLNPASAVYRWNILLLLAGSQAIAYIDRVNFAVVGPHLIKVYDYTPTQVGVLLSIIQLGVHLLAAWRRVRWPMGFVRGAPIRLGSDSGRLRRRSAA